MKTYYGYFDANSRMFYYYDTESGDRVWLYPDDGYVYDPKTRRPIYPPDSDLFWEDGDYGPDYHFDIPISQPPVVKEAPKPQIPTPRPAPAPIPAPQSPPAQIPPAQAPPAAIPSPAPEQPPPVPVSVPPSDSSPSNPPEPQGQPPQPPEPSPPSPSTIQTPQIESPSSSSSQIPTAPIESPQIEPAQTPPAPIGQGSPPQPAAVPSPAEPASLPPQPSAASLAPKIPPAQPLKNASAALLGQAMRTKTEGLQFIDFAKANFKGKAELLSKYSKDAVHEPLLKSLAGKENNSTAKSLHKFMLAYCQATPANEAKVQPNLTEIHGLLKKQKAFIDEAYCQALRIVLSAPQPGLVTRGLHIFLLLGTYFLPTNRDLITCVYASLSRLALLKANDPVTPLIIFSFMRFDATVISAGNAFEFHAKDPKEILKIPMHPYKSHFCFGVSLWEIYVAQAGQYPELMAPRAIHLIAERMFALGAETTQGIFRVPGNKAKTEQIIAGTAGDGPDYMADCSVHDVASAFKSWFRDIPGSIVGKSDMAKLMKMNDAKEQIVFASQLPFLNRMVLMYLVGVLRRVELAKEVTQMTLANLTMVFAPNIAFIDAAEDIKDVPKITAQSSLFLTNLIEHWNVAACYPVTSKF
jgi:hypothetical protein